VRRALPGEDGFTLVEMLVTIMVMIVVLFALYSIFDMSIRVFSFGNDKIEAGQSARLGSERMAREIRAAYPYDKGASVPDTHLFNTWTVNRITFANDLGAGDRVIDPATEQITYFLDGSTLKRAVGTGAGQPAVENVKPDNPSTAAYDGGLRFEYLKRSGTSLVTATSESEIQAVRIVIVVSKDGRTQELTTDVDLRNRA
jgi:prepilin-type N-terminal cleavage/methylation domain-containing protein